MENRKRLVMALNAAFNTLEDASFKAHGNCRPMLFIQEPFNGTHAIVFLKDVLHPKDTDACMDLIYSTLLTQGIEHCLIANDLTTIEVNCDFPNVECVVLNTMEEMADYVIKAFDPYKNPVTVNIRATCPADDSEFCSPQEFNFTIDNADELALLESICYRMEDGGYKITYTISH